MPKTSQPPAVEPPKKAAERILSTASDLFYREGARAIGVDEIVSRAGATKPSLYRAFESKDQLIAAYLQGQAEGFWAYFHAATDLHPGDIDVVAGQKGADRADDTRLVAVMGDEHVASERAVEGKAVDLHDGGVVAVPAHGDVVRQGTVVAADDLEGKVR